MKFEKNSITYAKIALIVVSALVFFSLLPLYTFDSYWYISYIDHFEGLVPFSEWDKTRGFVFPLLLFIANKVCRGNTGIEIVFLIIYFAYHHYIFKVYSLIKKYIGAEERIIELIVLDVLLVYSPMVWTYSHRVLTEGMAYPLFVLYLAIIIGYYLKQISNESKIKDTIIFLLMTAVCLIFGWYLKQSFSIYIVMVFLGTGLLVLIRKNKAKMILVPLLVVFILFVGWRVSVKIFQIVTSSEDSAAVQNTTGFAPELVGVNTSIKLRYFYPNSDNVIEIKNDEFVTEDSFVFESSKIGIARDVEFVIECCKHDFGRVVRSVVDNYMVMTSAYYSPNSDTWYSERYYGIEYGSVERNGILEPIKGHNAGKQSENERLCYIELKEPTNYYEDIEYKASELNERGIRTNRLSEYGYVAEKNIITRLISWKYYWAVTETLFIVTLIFAIWCWLPCGIVALIKKNPIIDILAINTMACFVFLSAHVYIGAAIERYSVPVYVTELLCCVCTIITIKDKILNRGIDNA